MGPGETRGNRRHSKYSIEKQRFRKIFAYCSDTGGSRPQMDGMPRRSYLRYKGEVFYHSWQERGEEFARKTISNLSRLPIETVPVDQEQSLKAGELKARHRIPYVDCLAAALAIMRRAVLVTSDRDFEKLGRRVQVFWTRHR